MGVEVLRLWGGEGWQGVGAGWGWDRAVPLFCPVTRAEDRKPSGWEEGFQDS